MHKIKSLCTQCFFFLIISPPHIHTSSKAPSHESERSLLVLLQQLPFQDSTEYEKLGIVCTMVLVYSEKLYPANISQEDSISFPMKAYTSLHIQTMPSVYQNKPTYCKNSVGSYFVTKTSQKILLAVFRPVSSGGDGDTGPLIVYPIHPSGCLQAELHSVSHMMNQGDRSVSVIELLLWNKKFCKNLHLKIHCS